MLRVEDGEPGGLGEAPTSRPISKAKTFTHEEAPSARKLVVSKKQLSHLWK